jgi:sphinganine-1-phosphate aldolase
MSNTTGWISTVLLTILCFRTEPASKILTLAIRTSRPFWWPVFFLALCLARSRLLVFLTLHPDYSNTTDDNNKQEALPTLLHVFLHNVHVVQDLLVNAISSLPARSPVQSILRHMIHTLFRCMQDVLAFQAILQVGRWCYHVRHFHFTTYKDSWIQSLLDWTQFHGPWVERRLDQAAAQLQSDASANQNKSDRTPHDTTTTRHLVLPDPPHSADAILAILTQSSLKENQHWLNGRVSGAVYARDAAHSDLLARVYALYAWSNPLHPTVWPQLRQCEAEVIGMTASMVHNHPASGTVTSGGTESIVLAIRASLYYYGTRRGICHPEMICGSTAHAAVYKACDVLGIRLIMVDCNDVDTTQSFQLQPSQVRQRITSNTILIYASAPSYPQGVMDPIEELSKIALEYDIGLHVDACLGGFVLPFLDDAPPFDFRVPGVTSMSVDTHKYGYASKGTSVVLYRTTRLRHGQYFCYAQWSGGLYCTPTLAGSRSGGLIACAWASLMSLGAEGYRQRAHIIVEASRTIATGIQNIPGLTLLTPKPYMVVCFGGTEQVDIYQVQDGMTARGWDLNSLQHPASIHICVTLNVATQCDAFLEDLQASVAQVMEEGPDTKKRGTAGIYGTVGSLPPGPVNHTLKAYLDTTLRA